MNVSDYHGKHKGQTCLIVGLAPNLSLTPPQWFNYPSFGVNTIYKQTEFTPTYFVGVDERLRLEDGENIVKAYPDVPKFFPRPDWDELQGENIVRFAHRQGGSLYIGGQMPNQKEALTKWGINYKRVMEAVLQIAWYMGFETMLMIGVQHKPNESRHHFWGVDAKEQEQPQDFWFEGYRDCVRMMNGVKVLNISEDTYVPADVLPRGDWRDWKNT